MTDAHCTLSTSAHICAFFRFSNSSSFNSNLSITGIQLSDVQLVYLIKILRLKKFDALSYSLSVFNKVVYKSLTGVELDEQLKEL